MGPCPDGMEACHNNGDQLDNRIENLRWDTHSANIYDQVAHGNIRPRVKRTAFGVMNSMTKTRE